MPNMPNTWCSRYGAPARLSLLVTLIGAGAGQAGGPEWEMVQSPAVGTGNNELYGLTASSPNDMWAVGRYSTSQGYRTLALRWDGEAWGVVATPNVGTSFNQLVSVTAPSSDDVWAVGASSDDNVLYQPMVQHWDGSDWSVVATPIVVGTSAYLYGVEAAGADDIWAVGYVNVGTAAQLTLVMHWDGVEWTTVESPNPSASRDILWSVSVASSDDVWAVGNSVADGEYETLIAHWDGSAWSAVPSANGPSINFLWGVEAFDADEVWALGRSYDGANYPALIERWDGDQWSLVAHPDEALYNELYAAVAVSADDVWAVGRHGGGFSNNVAVVTHWDGNAWDVVASPTPDPDGESYLYEVLAHSADELWAVGAYLDGFVYRPLIVHYSAGTTSTPAVAAVPGASLSAVPNPVRAHATLRFSLPSAGAVSIGLFDAAGRHVLALMDRVTLDAGPHEVAFGTAALSPGVYLARLREASRVTTHKLLIVR